MPPGVARGEWNHAVVVLGVPGTGKSTWALQRALQLGRTPAYVLAHDPAWRLPDKLPNGRPSGIQRHETIAQVQHALATAPAGVHAVACADGGEVVRAGVQLGKASLTAGGEQRGVPVVVLLDEAVATAGASPHRLGDELRELLATRRHLHVAIIITAQSPNLTHYAFLGLATELVVFRLVDDRSLAALERVGVPREKLSQIRALPNFRAITHRLA